MRTRPGQATLFPADRPIPADEVNALSRVMTDIRLLRPRNFGDCRQGVIALVVPLNSYAVNFRYPGYSADKAKLKVAMKACREVRDHARQTLGL